MALIECPDCGAQISDAAPACPHCGRPAAVSAKSQPKLDQAGAWCPNCGNRNSVKRTDGLTCLIIAALVVTVVGLLAIPFLPKAWHCNSCQHEWRA